MGVSRIGSSGAVSRDTPSSGFDAIEKREAREAKQPPRNQKVDEVAKLYEKQFLREMTKAMRGTIQFADKPSMAENIYRDQLDSEYVDTWSDQGGIGLSNLIYDQIMERYFGQTAGGREMKSQGPIALTDRDVTRVARVKTTEPSASGQVPLRIEVKPAQSGAPAQIQAPWEAKVVSKTRVDGKNAVTLEHGPGLRSTVVFDGVATAGTEPGAVLKKGTSIGTLNPEIRSFLWNLRGNLNESAALAAASPERSETAGAELDQSPAQKGHRSEVR